MKIGIIGAGRMAQSFAWLATRAGYRVMLSNSRGPDSIRPLAGQLGCEAGEVDEAAGFGDVIYAALPLQSYRAVPAAPLAGKLVLNPQNYFPQFGLLPELDRGTATTAELLARHLPSSRVVKALNAILVEDVVPDARPAGAPDRRALPIAGDDADARATTIALLDRIGYDAVDAGPLAEGWRFERRRPAYCVRLGKAALAGVLEQTTRDALVPEGHWRLQRELRA
ncbi:NADPH-dependent F420 reductase [Burkholderia plantarii]|uniref:NADPH-dependent F420 reductase n=1 Tax=Burkholderia plantarii TaxID=41899 RepID=UPI0018DCBA5A|nr:NAD(P)-binding domain-containing protein [Burkholderia plantarii]MBI0325749.1 NAD(P)-binding domain-containing protein [Burkholderia plantarii]